MKEILDPLYSTGKLLTFPDLKSQRIIEGATVVDESSLILPTSQKLIADAATLDRLSKYPSKFDYSAYEKLEARFLKKPIRGGITFKRPFRLVNSHPTCQQCLYAFEIDTYGRGCIHDCVYCYAKAELTVHGYWNNPMPVPSDINEIRKTFYTVFETQKPNKWRSIMERRIPIRIGSMTDSFMLIDKKYKVTQELLRILKHYNYPCIIFTRSDLVAHDEYIELLDKDLCSVQMSISSINDKLNAQLEPGAPSAKRRLLALKTLSEEGFWTTVRVNPMFPIYPDGYFTNPNFKWEGEVPKFEYTSFDIVDAIAEHKVPSMLAGFVRFSSFALNNIEKVTGFDMRQFYNKNDVNKSKRDWHFTDKEIRYYYTEFKKRCVQKNLQFTTCYIGNGEGHFWKDQDLWSNKRDCCNVKDRVKNIGASDSREIAFSERLKFSSHKETIPGTDRLHEKLGTKIVVTSNPPRTNGDEWKSELIPE